MPLNQPSIGGPTHQDDVTASRTINTVYQNTKGRTLFVGIMANVTTGNAGEQALLIGDTDSATPPTVTAIYTGIVSSLAQNPQNKVFGFMVVLPGNYYRARSAITGAATCTLVKWMEWY